MRPLAVVALGGNALLRRGETPSLHAELANVRRAARTVARLARSHRVVVTHGNGPQVGSIVLRSELAARRTYALTLDVAVAESEGELGYAIQQALHNALDDPVACVLTQVVVSPHDPALRHPTKPIGALLDARAARAARQRGAAVAHDGTGWRRVVASPTPIEIVETPAIRRLVSGGFVVVAAGGGGVPVVKRRGKLSGVEGVIDKDRASAVLAIGIKAASLFLLTDVDGVYLDFGSPSARRIPRLTQAQARRYLAEGQFPAGSMGPKVHAALDFLARRPRGRVVIGNMRDPNAGTVITV